MRREQSSGGVGLGPSTADRPVAAGDKASDGGTDVDLSKGPPTPIGGSNRSQAGRSHRTGVANDSRSLAGGLQNPGASHITDHSAQRERSCEFQLPASARALIY